MMTIAYPWTGIEDRFPDGIEIVVYGSLLNRESAALTLSDATIATARPVVAIGGRRTFDYEIGPNSPRWPVTGEGRAIAALNVRITGEATDTVNGLLLRIPRAEMAAFRSRERNYRLVSVPCQPWGDATATPFDTWILSSDGGANPDVTPHPGYYQVCREGARKIGPDFLESWLSTTYLADGITPVKSWETKRGPGLPS